MLMGAFWGVYGADKGGTWIVGVLVAMLAGGLLALVHAFFAIHLRADQIVGGTAVNFLAVGITGYFFFQLYHGQDVPVGISTIPKVHIPYVEHWRFLGPAIGRLNLMVWLSLLLVAVSYVVLFKTPIGLRIRACGEHPRAADTVAINVYRVRYGAVVLSGILAALGGAYLSIGFGGGTFTDNMTAGRGFIALAALIFGKWRPFGTLGAALLFGASTALAYRLPVYSSSRRTPVPGASLCTDAGRRRRRDRQIRSARGGWPSVQEAIAPSSSSSCSASRDAAAARRWARSRRRRPSSTRRPWRRRPASRCASGSSAAPAA